MFISIIAWLVKVVRWKKSSLLIRSWSSVKLIHQWWRWSSSILCFTWHNLRIETLAIKDLLSRISIDKYKMFVRERQRKKIRRFFFFLLFLISCLNVVVYRIETLMSKYVNIILIQIDVIQTSVVVVVVCIVGFLFSVPWSIWCFPFICLCLSSAVESPMKTNISRRMSMRNG